MDTFTPQKRSEIMRAVHSKGNKSTEIRLIENFKRLSIKGWRRNYNIKGHPDFVFPKSRLVVFADGCFWHGHNCRTTKPSTNVVYWENKIACNRRRDKDISKYLGRKGWIVVRMWECEMRSYNSPKLSKIKKIIEKVALLSVKNINVLQKTLPVRIKRGGKK
jgi:DNA mismatch endonuclease (patch repair protein)